MTTDTAAHEKAREIVDREPFADSFRGFPICRLAAIEVLTAEILAAEQRGREAAVPAGWRLVPVEATPDMTQAYYDLCREEGSLAVRGSSIWSRMLAAAPQPKEPPRFSEVRFTQNGNATSKESDDVGKA